MKEILDFLRELACNNNRDWFNAHKDWYKRCHEKVKVFTAQWLEQLVKIDPELAGVKETTVQAPEKKTRKRAIRKKGDEAAE